MTSSLFCSNNFTLDDIWLHQTGSLPNWSVETKIVSQLFCHLWCDGERGICRSQQEMAREAEEKETVVVTNEGKRPLCLRFPMTKRGGRWSVMG